MPLPSRNNSTYALPNRNTGVLLKEDGFALLQENGDEILIENPTHDPNLSARNASAYSLGARSTVITQGTPMGLLLVLTSVTNILSGRNSSAYSLSVRN